MLSFSAGKANASLRTTDPAVCGTVPVSGLHHKAPTHGCTFHPTDKVTFCRSASRPVMSLTWYLAFWPRSRSTPGVDASGFWADLDLGRFAARFAAVDDEADAAEERRAVAFSFSASHAYGDGVAGMIVSQTMASEARTRDSARSDDEYVA